MFEKEGTQRIIMVFMSLGFIALLVVPALDHRFGWSAVPTWAVVLGLPRARRDDAVSALAAPRRGENPDEGFAGIRGIPAACTSSSLADGLVASIDMSQACVISRRAEVTHLSKVETIARATWRVTYPGWGMKAADEDAQRREDAAYHHSSSWTGFGRGRAAVVSRVRCVHH